MILTTPKISSGIVLVALILIGAFLIYWPASEISADIEVRIEQGTRASEIAEILEERGIIRSKNLFLFYLIIAGEDKNLKHGTYVFFPKMNIPAVVNLLSNGLSKSEDVIVTFPEGFNIWEIIQRLKETGLISKNEDFVSGAEKHEGYLFPDTYRFKKNSTVENIIKKMTENFNEKTEDFSSLNRDRVIMASILEREVRSEEDMKLVSGILWKRLNAGMLLQADATVAYGMCKKIGPFDCNVNTVALRDNLLVDSPYNTYKKFGLPIGPISNPGLKALEAAINPTESDYWFYLSATAEDSRTIFSKTSAEHERNRVRYIKK